MKLEAKYVRPGDLHAFVADACVNSVSGNLPCERVYDAAAVELLLETINQIACYVSEEDTSARYEGLQEIGRLVRGEPSTWLRPRASSPSASGEPRG